MLESLLADRSQTQLQVAAATGIANSTLSNVLHGKRQLARDHIRWLAKHFQVDPGVFHGSTDTLKGIAHSPDSGNELCFGLHISQVQFKESRPLFANRRKCKFLTRPRHTFASRFPQKALACLSAIRVRNRIHAIHPKKVPDTFDSPRSTSDTNTHEPAHLELR